MVVWHTQGMSNTLYLKNIGDGLYTSWIKDEKSLPNCHVRHYKTKALQRAMGHEKPWCASWQSSWFANTTTHAEATTLQELAKQMGFGRVVVLRPSKF